MKIDRWEKGCARGTFYFYFTHGDTLEGKACKAVAEKWPGKPFDKDWLIAADKWAVPVAQAWADRLDYEASHPGQVAQAQAEADGLTESIVSAKERQAKLKVDFPEITIPDVTVTPAQVGP